MVEHISCHFKCKVNRTISNSNQQWNNKTYQCECKNYHKCSKDDSSNPNTRISENSRYFKTIADMSVSECDKIIFVMDIVSTKEINTIATKKTNFTIVK